MLNETVPEATAAEQKSAASSRRMEDKGSALWREIKGLFWVLLAVLAFHSLDRQAFLYPVGIDDAGPADGRSAGRHQISLWMVVGQSPSFHIIGPMKGRLFGRMPERGDIVIVTPPGTRTDYIKRVIGLPGDTLRMVDGQLYHQRPGGEAPGRSRPTWSRSTSIRRADPTTTRRSTTSGSAALTASRIAACRSCARHLPNGHSYETVELGRSSEDNFGPVTVPEAMSG